MWCRLQIFYLVVEEPSILRLERYGRGKSIKAAMNRGLLAKQV